ncbi:hypothetical protein COU77_02235 [Candidatus Peregrinibacteria bacterium CG10_big_fil_rev_8_21_14_0_10_49_16]|nr:MAG: hypothetical protein COW95_00745 [Candidatus Peregrinibacteria bacterium CG22_combo_CG10-13_8_21_14_all_49_11]PIR52097.1 MAG: hypothetical protein COU77_02235 [Candidatus Peregrinibacteria bacterium CG10_big_fil_rev_8_21_14_0_10_49_16]
MYYRTPFCPLRFVDKSYEVFVYVFFVFQRLAPHIKTGRVGEKIAVRFLRRKGYRILDRNVRVGCHGEIDIIAFDPHDHVIAFVEVKTRSSESCAFVPEANITWEKRKRMRRSATRWVAMQDYDGAWRCDVVCIAGDAVTEHFVEVDVSS